MSLVGIHHCPVFQEWKVRQRTSLSSLLMEDFEHSASSGESFSSDTPRDYGEDEGDGEPRVLLSAEAQERAEFEYILLVNEDEDEALDLDLDFHSNAPHSPPPSQLAQINSDPPIVKGNLDNGGVTEAEVTIADSAFDESTWEPFATSAGPSAHFEIQYLGSKSIII
jgi:hypothetical protein